MTTAQQLAQISDTAIMCAAIVYCLALLAHIAEWALSRNLTNDPVMADTATAPAYPATESPMPTHRGRMDAAGRIGVSLTVAAFGLHLAGILARALATERVPWGNMYEFTITGGAAAVATYLILLCFQPVRWLGLPTTALAVVMLMLAVLVLDVPAGPLVPALQTYWLVIHVSAALIATGAFTVGAVASVLFLLRQRSERNGTQARGFLSRLPTVEAIDRVAYQVHAFAFPVWTFAVLIAGPIWAKYAWGRYWGWDPKEVWAFVTWGAYAAYLHARATADWRGRRASILALIGFATLWFNFIGVNFFISGLHSYAGK